MADEATTTQTTESQQAAEKANAASRNQRAIATGYVISDKRSKTISVEIKRLVKHSRYKKYTYRSTVHHAHDENNEAGLGDLVQIQETRPISKQKHWRLLKIVTKAPLTHR